MKSALGRAAIFIAKGLAIGLAGTQALDVLSTFIYENEDRKTRKAEDRVRHNRHAYEVGVSQLARSVMGLRLSRKQEQVWGWRMHKAFGIGAGLAYLAVRRKHEGVGAGRGLAFGALFFLIMDELIVPLSGQTPGPLAFNWKVHGRGAVSHLAYGVAAETAARWLD